MVWRSPSSVQVGIDPPRAVVEPVGPGAERMLAALVSGATEPGLAVLSAGEDDPHQLLATLGPVLEAAHPARESRVAVRGTGPTAGLVARLLIEQDVRLAGTAGPSPDAGVIVAHYAVPPGARGTWLRDDVPHLPVVYSDTAVVVGPLIRPGLGPCLTCVELHHRDQDPAWPALASQLIDRTSTAEFGVLTAEAAATAVRVLLSLLRGPIEPGGEQAIAVRIDGSTGERSAHVVTRHPHCSCAGLPVSAAPPGTGSEDEPRRGRVAAPTTGRDVAARA